MGMKSKSGYLYVGCFLSEGDLSRLLRHVGGSRLECLAEHAHVTFDFLPDSAVESSFGKLLYFDVVGYANDGLNEGVSVVLVSTPEELAPIAQRRDRHHITLSLASGARAADTAHLAFAPVSPLRISATYGGCTPKGEVVLLPNGGC